MRNYSNKLVTASAWFITPNAPSAKDKAVLFKHKKMVIVYRHYRQAMPARMKFYDEMRRLARARRHIMLCAIHQGFMPMATKREGIHLPAHVMRAPALYGWGSARIKKDIVSASIHNEREFMRAARAKCDYVLLSPLFATRSHPDQKKLNRMVIARIMRHAKNRWCNAPAIIALGGITPRTKIPFFANSWHGVAMQRAFYRL